MHSMIEGLGVGAALLGAGLIALSVIFALVGCIVALRRALPDRIAKYKKAFSHALVFFIAGVILIIMASLTGALPYDLSHQHT